MRWTYPIKSLDILGDVDDPDLAKSLNSTRFSQEKERQAVWPVVMIEEWTEGQEMDGSHKERYIEVEQDSARRIGREQ